MSKSDIKLMFPDLYDILPHFDYKGSIYNTNAIFDNLWAHILLQVTIYRRLCIGRDYPKPTIYRNFYENTGS